MIDRELTRGLLAIARTFAKAKGWQLTTVSRKIHGKASFFGELAARRCSLTVANLDRLLQEFSDQWPDGTAWPPITPVAMARPPQRKKSVKKVDE